MGRGAGGGGGGSMDAAHGPGSYFDGPGPWTGSTEGVHVLYFPNLSGSS